MSSFCWCIIKIEETHINPSWEQCKKHERNGIYCIFDNSKNRFLEQALSKNEIFCNIACGYDYLPPLSKKGILNNDEQFLGYAFPPKKRIDNNAFELARMQLKHRLKLFQDVVFDIYKTNCVVSMDLYYTDSANECSLSEYMLVDWQIAELHEKMYEALENDGGILPSFRLLLNKKLYF